jgi:starch synthase
VFTFEFSGIVKVGGLGEVPANQTKWLSESHNYNITVFIPSHGVHKNKELMEKYSFNEINFKCSGDLDALRFNLGDKTERFNISFFEGKIDNSIKCVLLVGNNEFTARILNDPVVYSSRHLSGKILLFSKGMKYYIKKILDEKQSEKTINIPKIIHCHDYHAVPAMIATRQQLLAKKLDVATVITIHLLTYPRQTLEFLWECGIEDVPMDFYIGDQNLTLTVSELYEFCRGNEKSEPTLEKIGVFFSDQITSVSEDYLKSEVVPILGGGWINGKSNFIWNGCDWDYEAMIKNTERRFGDKLRTIDGVNPMNRSTLRKYLLTVGLGELSKNEPEIQSEEIKDFLGGILTDFPYKADVDGKFSGKIHPFSEDGPLIISTGRISDQKGFKVLMNSIPRVLEEFPKSKFVLFLMPTEFSLNEIKELHNIAKNYTNNLRILFGKVFSIFQLIHLAADIYCAPSMWEPFGIIALEAMISKLPVVASRIGGLKESILDIIEHPVNGTGFLVPVDNPNKLSKALINLITILEIDQDESKNLLSNEKFESYKIKIENDILIDILNRDRNFGSKIRENCKLRVESNFRWKSVVKKLPIVYNKAIKIRNL